MNVNASSRSDTEVFTAHTLTHPLRSVSRGHYAARLRGETGSELGPSHREGIWQISSGSPADQRPASPYATAVERHNIRVSMRPDPVGQIQLIGRADSGYGDRGGLSVSPSRSDPSRTVPQVISPITRQPPQRNLLPHMLFGPPSFARASWLDSSAVKLRTAARSSSAR